MPKHTDIVVKQAVIRQAEVIYNVKLANDFQPRHATCLQWAVAVISACSMHNIKAVLQAGSAYWRHIPDSEDDGSRNLFYGYQYDTQEAIAMMCVGVSPEMHCWVGIPETDEVVDITTKFQHIQAKEQIGEEWHADCVLPPYLWASDFEGLDYIYDPSAEATALAIRFVLEGLGGSRHD